MPRQFTHRGSLACVASIVTLMLLSGCASTIQLDNDVRSFSAWGPQLPQPGDIYRFERLPSQAQNMAEQAAIEGLAEEVLQGLGLTQQATDTPPANTARWTVQLQARASTLPHAPWEYPQPFGPTRGWLSLELGSRSKSAGVRAPLFIAPPTPYYLREITVIVRNAQNGTVVFETQAAHDGPWAHTTALWKSLLDAALKDFPLPPQGKRRVVTAVPR